MRQKLSVSAAAMLAATVVMAEPAANWAKEPDGYRGIPWKGTIADAHKKVDSRGTCTCYAVEGSDSHKGCRFQSTYDAATAPFLRVCGTTLDIGGIEVSDFLFFERDLLHSAYMQFPAVEFDKMAGIFVEKYGPPTSSQDTEVSNRMGAKFTNTSMAWRGNTVTVTLERYGSDLTKSTANITLNEFAARQAAAEAAKRKKGAEDF